MNDAFFLAWRYMTFHRLKSLTMIVALAVAIVMPLGFRVMAARFRAELTARAEQIPWVIGPRGSEIEQVMAGLYFESITDSPLKMSDWRAAQGNTSGKMVPVYSQFEAAGAPVVGTTLGYFEQLGLRIADGKMMGRLGDAVLGANVARRLQLTAGGSLLTDSSNRVNLAGSYPLKMRITGVLERTGTPDDDAVFVDIKTAWVIAGIGHGHQDVDASDETQTLAVEGNNVVASAAVTPYTEITDENLATFHFHGTEAERPITVILAWPSDRRDADLMQGRFIDGAGTLQLASAKSAVERLIASVLRLQMLLDLSSLFLVLVSGLFFALVMSLTYQLRAPERRTLHYLGCARGMVLKIQLAEMLLVVGASLLLASVAMTALWSLGWSFPRAWLA